jgi:HD-like signal output (HDOD) protein
MGEEEPQKDWEKSLKKRIEDYDKKAPISEVVIKVIASIKSVNRELEKLKNSLNDLADLLDQNSALK